jgi:NAD(P)-dependent dehydrogenase (short-subunit alcohol dehydrogenase family)
MSLNKNFDNKVVLVTGSNSGIGESTVILFSKLGAKCVVTGRNETKNFEVAKKCEEVSPHKYKVLINYCFIFPFLHKILNFLLYYERSR